MGMFMNQRIIVPARTEDPVLEPQAQKMDVDSIIAAARRQWRVAGVCMAVCLVLGTGYILTAVPRYTARTSVLIDRNNGQVVEQLSTIGGVPDDEASVLSQVELLKSDTIALSVVDKIKLSENSEFMGGGGNLLTAVVTVVRNVLNPASWFGDGEGALAEETERKRREALDRIRRSMDISRVGRSYVLEVAVSSTSPQLAAAVAGGIAEAYLNDKLDAKYEATRRAGTWLQERIEELRQRSLESDLAVQKFRAAHGLLVANDQLVSDQQLTELSSALLVARADTARAQAKYDRIQSILKNGQTDAIVTDALESSVINTLREKYLDASKRESEIRKRLGEGHVQAIRLRQEMAEYTRLMFDELGRIAESYQSELEVSQSREQQIVQGLGRATDVSVIAGETQVELRELERSAETYKNLYQTFLQRFQEALQQQSFPVTEARIISHAVPPREASEPRALMILGLSLVLGALIGSAVGAFREFRDRFFRTGEQVREVLGLEYLGAVPRVDPAKEKPLTEEPVRGRVYRRNQVSNYAIEHPLSSFAETLRSARIAVDLQVSKPQKIIGIVSALPGEGKSTIAVNLAQTLAKSAKTLLIDADLRNPGATRALGQHADEGLLEVLLDNLAPSSVVLSDPISGLMFLPAVVKRRIPHSSELLASQQMVRLLAQASSQFEYIVIDLPPLAPVVDARAIASRIDGFVMVVEWGTTSRKVIRDTLMTEPQVASRCLGVILNKIDSEKMKLYREYGSSDYYASRYTSYYHEDV
jgi:succinoglycan biosynthesis transport protein ExoP